MKKHKPISLFVIFVILLNIFLVSSVSAESMSPPEIVGKYGVTIDGATGEILYDKNANEQAYPASTTKIMTALLLVEKMKPEEKIVLSENAVGKDRSNSQIIFKAGETMDRDAALYTMMVISANDVATAIGEHIAGSEEKFGQMMTERAKQLGAVNTNFVTASGLHDPQHYTTTYDMALITKEAIKNDLLMNAMAAKEYEVHTNLQTKKVVNPSKIHNDPAALGGKTGFTDEARNTLVKVDEIDGKRTINVVMRSNLQNIYDDIKKISDYGISQIESQVVVDKTNWSENLTFLEKPLLVVPEKSLTLTKKINDTSNYQTKFVQTFNPSEEQLYVNGILNNQKVGEIEVLKGDKLIEKVNVISTQDVYFEKKKQVLFPMWLKIILAIVIPILAYAGFVVTYNRKLLQQKKRPV